MDKILNRSEILKKFNEDFDEDENYSENGQFKKFLNFTIDETLRAVRQEIAEYSGINDIQTKELIKLITNL